METKYIPYVYLIKNKTTGLKYLGVKYAKGCNPETFWKDYFTSSKLVHKLIDEFGKEDFIFKIIHKFPDDPKAAILKESKYFPLLKQRVNYLNLCYSSGCIDLRIASKGGHVGGAITKNRGVGIFRDEEDRRKWASMGGKVGGKKQAELGLGFHLYKSDPEQHRKNSSKGGITSGQFQNKEFQSEMGKRGGIKNKGFKWYTDGVRSYKYTAKQQEQKSFDDFLQENKRFKKGHNFNKVKNENKIN